MLRTLRSRINTAPNKSNDRIRNRRGRRKSSVSALLKEAEPEIEPIAYITPWEAFQEHLRLIDDNTAMYPGQQIEQDKSGRDEIKEEEEDDERSVEQKALELAQALAVTIKVKNSDVFSKTMHEFQLRKQQYLERQAAIQRERERRLQEELDAGKEVEPEETQEEEEEEEEFDSDWSDADEVEQVDAGTLQRRQTATRAWGIIRRHIEEKSMENKQKSSKMNWNFLRQTMANMTDMEKGRQNLYERYLNKPDQWKEGFTHFPADLLNRDKTRGRRRYVPPPSTKPKTKKQLKHKNSTEIKSH